MHGFSEKSVSQTGIKDTAMRKVLSSGATLYRYSCGRRLTEISYSYRLFQEWKVIWTHTEGGHLDLFLLASEFPYRGFPVSASAVYLDPWVTLEARKQPEFAFSFAITPNDHEFSFSFSFPLLLFWVFSFSLISGNMLGTLPIGALSISGKP